jgi:hypothetical protein
MWISLAVWGCGPPSGQDGQQQVAGELDLGLEPAGLDFGTVPLGQAAEQSLTIHNRGTSDVLVAELRLSDQQALAVMGFDSPKIRAGAEEELTVQWTPSDASDLDGSLDLRVGTALDSLSDLEVPVVGTVSGPKLVISEASGDLGTVLVGCTKSFEVVATNTGTEELAIQRLTLTNDQEFSLEDGAGGALQLPFTIAPEDSRPIHIVYTPTAEHTTTTTLQIESNDAVAPVTTVNVDGEGSIEGSNTLWWTVEGQQAVTAIITVNEWVISTGSGFDDDLRDFVPALFQALHDSEASYRVAIVMHEDGHVPGGLAYIDDSFSVDEAVVAAEEMLEGSSSHGDNDMGLQTCVNAIEENEDWLLEDDLWLESRLNFLVINSDVEQSPYDAKYYVEQIRDSKNEDDGTGDFAVHGIAGPPMAGGCSGGGEHAEPSQNLYEATDLSGGVFNSICEDWSVPELVEGFTGNIEVFELTGNPAPWSIEVRIDGAQVSTGWWYDEKTKQIVFDEASYPVRGAELRVDYLWAVSCG